MLSANTTYREKTQLDDKIIILFSQINKHCKILYRKLGISSRHIKLIRQKTNTDNSLDYNLNIKSHWSGVYCFDVVFCFCKLLSHSDKLVLLLNIPKLHQLLIWVTLRSLTHGKNKTYHCMNGIYGVIYIVTRRLT